MFSADQLRRIVRARDLPKYASAITDACADLLPAHGIDDPNEIIGLVATMAVETRFAILEENMSYTAPRIREVWPTRFKSVAAAKPYARNPEKLANKVYGGRMGNAGKPGAGYNYRGSGPGQTTGYDLFKLAEDATGLPLTSDPDILRTDPVAGVRAFLAFWQHRKIDVEARKGDWRRVRRLVNGGYIGWNEFNTFVGRAVAMYEREGFGIDVQIDPADAGGDQEQADAVADTAASEPNPRTGLLPLYRPKQADAVTRAVLAKYSDLTPLDGRDDLVRVLVVRGYYGNQFGKSGNDRGVYDDAVFVVTPDGVQSFNGNSDPSVWRRRVATIKAPQAIRYRPGLHGYNRKAGPYPAFRQDAPCTVVRDNVGDDTGLFHVNLHRGGVSETSSLGCLTIPAHQWDEFHALLTGVLIAHDQATFYVTLVEYDGDKPPVKVPTHQVIDPDAFTREDGATLAALAAAIAAVAGWWDSATTLIGGLF